jgi:hypothetical protein
MIIGSRGTCSNVMWVRSNFVSMHLLVTIVTEVPEAMQWMKITR